MITTDINRAEFTANDSADIYVFNNGTVDIPVKEASHIKVYVTDTGTFTADHTNETFTNVTVNGASNTSHGHTVGQAIKVSGTTLPIGIVENTDYYVRDVGAITFKLALSAGGSAVTISSNGSDLTWTRTVLKVISTDYTVSISSTNVATITWVSGKRPLNNVKFFFLREVPYEQTIDLLNNSLIEAESLETQLDLIVNQIQQLKNSNDRVLKYSDNLLIADATSIQATLNVDATDRANKSLKFDVSGNLGVTTVDIDKAEDYVLEAKSWSIEDGIVQKYDGTVASNVSPAEYSSKEYAQGDAPGGSAKEWATDTSAVTGSLYSSKEYAQGDTAATGGSSKNWASETGVSNVTGGSAGDFSAKSWALEEGSTAPTDGSAKQWATLATTPSGSTTDASAKEWAIGTSTHKNEFSAKEYAQGTATGGTAKEWAQKIDAAVDTTFSSREYAQGDANSDAVATGGSAKGWSQDTAKVNGATTNDRSSKAWSQGASMTGSTLGGSSKDWSQLPVSTGTVDGTLYSSKAYAQSTTAGTSTYGGSAKGWASTVYGDAVPGAGASDRSALHYSTDASNSAIAAKNSANAVANTFDAFDDTYLGTMSDTSAQGTNPTTNGTWAKDSSAITVVSGTNIKVGQVVTGTGMPSPPPNVISVSGTAVVVSENMAALGSAVALTFTGYGVYGTYNGTKDGPATDNDNGALADGMLYFNSTDNNMMVYKETGASWIAATSSGGVSLVMHKAVASGTPTSFAATDFTPTLSYEVNNIVVFLNGVRLDATDYTATTGTTITGLVALSASDEMTILAFKTFEVADAVSAASGGTFSGAVIHSGAVTNSSTTTATGLITANGGLETDTNSKIKQKGAFMQSSTHQALTLGA